VIATLEDIIEAELGDGELEARRSTADRVAALVEPRGGALDDDAAVSIRRPTVRARSSSCRSPHFDGDMGEYVLAACA